MRRLLILLSVSCSAAMAQEPDAVVSRTYDLGGLGLPAPSLRRGDEALPRPLGTHASVSYESEEGDLEAGEADGAEGFAELVGYLVGETKWHSLSGGFLRVHATVAQHVSIQKALDTLVHQGGTPLEIEIRSYSIPMAAIDDGLRRELSQATAMEEAMVQRLAALDREQGRLSGTCHVMPGSWGRYDSVIRSSYLPDFDVEIAQGRAIADPVVGVVREGIALAIRPHLLEDGSVLARVIASSGNLERPLRRFRAGTTDLGDLELADFRGAGVSTELVLRPNAYSAVVVAAPHSARGGSWEILLLRLRAVPDPAPASNLAILPLGALSSQDFSLRYGWTDDGRMRIAQIESDRRFEAQDLMGWIGAQESEGVVLPVAWLHGGALLVVGDTASAKPLRTALAALQSSILQPVRLNLRLLAVGPQTVPDETTPAAGLLSLPLLAGRTAGCSTYLSREHVADYDVEVAQDARIGDPIVRAAYGGLFANLRLNRTGPRAYRLRLELRIAGVDDEIREISHGAKEVGPVQDLATRTLLLSPTLDLQAGAAKVTELGADPTDPTGARRLFLLATLLDG